MGKIIDDSPKIFGIPYDSYRKGLQTSLCINSNTSIDLDSNSNGTLYLDFDRTRSRSKSLLDWIVLITTDLSTL
jgi:hypothetical protein